MKTFTLSIALVLCLLINANAQNPEAWGLTWEGGVYNQGTIYKCNPNGSGQTIMHNFQGPAGWHPVGKLLQAWDGNFYGACYDGGMFASCTIFRFNPYTLVYEDVWDFDIVTGDFPRSGLIEGPDGTLYGVAPFGGSSYGGVIYKYHIATDTYTMLYSFNSITGSSPWSTPIFIDNENLYGTATYGGVNNGGVLWKYNITTNQYSNCIDLESGSSGSAPYGSLIKASNNILYGMASEGGVNNLGTIYSYNPANSFFSKVYDFSMTSGGVAKGALLEVSPGVLYGLTSSGGSNSAGTIFKYEISSGIFTKLYDFDGINGANPTGDLSIDIASGKLTGTTDMGGQYGKGVMFSYDQTTNTYTKLLDFNGSNGSYPTGGVVSFLPTSVAENNILNNEVSVFPNPATDRLFITIPGNASFKEVTLSDVNGKIILKEKIINNIFEIDISDYASGLYTVIVKTDEEINIRKFVK